MRSMGRLGWWLAAAFGGVVLLLLQGMDGAAGAGERHGFLSLFSWSETRYGDGPDRVVGSGRVGRQERPLAGFQAISLRGPVNLVLEQGEVERATVRADDNLLDLIETRVQDGQLQVGVRPGASFRTARPVIVQVEFRRLDGLQAEGSGDISCSHLEADRLELSLRGSGEIDVEELQVAALTVLVKGSGDLRLAGRATLQGYVLDGSGNVDAADLAGRQVGLRINGSGSAKVRANERLTVEINGSGDVAYIGQPTVLRTGQGSGAISHD